MDNKEETGSSSEEKPRDGKKPSWASGWGEDEFGTYAEFTVDDVVQLLRWIPPGRFWMGAPEQEEGRLEWEGPRHEVAFGSGFWMMDTPVQQSLWQAVTGKNPSRHVGRELPVECVNWKMIQEFLSRLNDQIAGLELALPSEAQWEYACRAGSEAAIYTKDLNQIAWWSGNSQSETHPVGQKLENAYGLHDMLGNIDEWCADYWHSDYKGAPTDGSAWQGKRVTSHRVKRGGSCLHAAKSVRAAWRYAEHPTTRSGGIGFRCVHTQS